MMRRRHFEVTILAMRSAYKYLAYAIDVLILLQAAAIAWAVFGLDQWIDAGNGHSLARPPPKQQDVLPRGDRVRHPRHQRDAVIPLVGLILLIISFFAKVPEGPKWAGMVFVGIVHPGALGVLATACRSSGSSTGSGRCCCSGWPGAPPSRLTWWWPRTPDAAGAALS